MATNNNMVLPIKQGTENFGKNYERQVTLYIAAILDSLNYIEDFHICCNTDGMKIFEDIVVKCSYKTHRKEAYFIQLKHSKKDLLLGKSKCKKKEYAVFDMASALLDIKKMSAKRITAYDAEKSALDTFLDDVDDRFFYIFTNMVKIDNETGSLSQATTSDYNPLYMLANEKIYKCIFNDNNDQKMFIINNQPDTDNITAAILQKLGNKFTADMVVNIIDDIHNFINNVRDCNVMDKKTFQSICLQQLISPELCINTLYMASIANMDKRFHSIWNNIFQKHNIIVIENKSKLRSLLAHYYERKIREYDSNFDWKKCVENTFQLNESTKHIFRGQFNLNLNQKINSLKDLLILMWWLENWPLIVHVTDVNKHVHILNHYEHLQKKFILIMDKPNNVSFPKNINVFQNVSQIKDKKIREEIGKLSVSLQGKSQVVLADIVSNCESIYNAITASHILDWSAENYIPIIGIHLKCRRDDYIKRCFERKSTTYTEEEVVEDLINQFHFLVIANETGMGKTTTLHSLSLKYNPKNLSGFINLADLKDLHNWKKKGSPYEYFYDKIQPTEDNLFKAIFKAHQSNGRLCLFFDSFNEILATHERHIKAILDEITKNEDAKLIITTRSQAKKILDDYSANYIELIQFNQEDVNRYCSRHNIPLTLIKNYPMLTNALHLSMLPTVYKKLNAIKNWDTTDLYREFILIQISQYICEKKGIQDIRGIGASIHRDLMDVHYKLSLVSGFKQSKLIDMEVLKTGEFDRLKDEFEKFQNSLGLISNIDDSGKVKFVHDVYGHYLRAEWFYRNSQNKRFSELYVMLLESRFLYDTVHLLNMMANSGKNNAITAIMNEDYDAISEFIREERKCLLESDDLERYPIHIAAWYSKSAKSKRIFKMIHEYVQKKNNQILTESDKFNLTWINYMQAGTTDFDLPQKIKKRIADFEDVNNIFVVYDHNLYHKKILPSDMNVLHYAISFTTDTKFVKYLLDQGADRYEKDEGKNALQIAISEGHSPEIVKILLRYRADEEAIHKFLHSKDCAYLAVSSKSIFAFEIFQVLIDCGMNPMLVEKDDQGRTCLHHAATSPSDDAHKIFELLLSFGMKLDDTDLNGKDVRYYSTLSTSENANKIAELLISDGVDVCEPDKNGMNYFHHVALSNSPTSHEITKLLLNRKIDPSVADNQGRNCLHLAALSDSPNSYKTVKLLLDHGITLTIRDKSQRNYLHFAALSSSENAHKTIELLLNHKVDPAEVDEQGKNSLHYAILSQSENAYKVVQLLLKQNVNPNIVDNNGKSCLHYHEFFESKYACQILELLLSHHLLPNITDSDGRTCLFYENIYYTENAKKVIELLLKNGLNPNQSDKNGKICLHNDKLFDIENTRKTIKLLLDNHLNPNHMDNDGNTCLHNKSIYYMDKSRSTVEMLLQYNLDPNITDADGKNCLHYEEIFYSDNALKMVELLLEFGLDAKKTDKNGNNCLHYESIHYGYNSRRMVELLLKHGLDPNQRNNEGKICLHYPNLYYSENARNMAILLLQHNLNPNILDADGKNCLHYKDLYLSEYARYMIHLLLQNNLDPNQRDKYGNHCLHYALQVDNEQVYLMVDLLCQYLDFTQTDLNGQTYLHDITSSTSENAHKILSVVLKYDHNPNRTDHRGITALHLASLSSSPISYKMVEVLLNHPDIDVTKADNEGNTCLHYACSSKSVNNYKTVKMLLPRIGDPGKENIVGKTCLHDAVTSNSPKAHKVVKQLLKCNLNPNKHDANGKDCFFYGSLADYPKVHKLKAVLNNCNNCNIK